MRVSYKKNFAHTVGATPLECAMGLVGTFSKAFHGILNQFFAK
jgi:hypothetical protein